jgi:hypothetical protein
VEGNLIGPFIVPASSQETEHTWLIAARSKAPVHADKINFLGKRILNVLLSPCYLAAGFNASRQQGFCAFGGSRGVTNGCRRLAAQSGSFRICALTFCKPAAPAFAGLGLKEPRSFDSPRRRTSR